MLGFEGAPLFLTKLSAISLTYFVLLLLSLLQWQLPKVHVELFMQNYVQQEKTENNPGTHYKWLVEQMEDCHTIQHSAAVKSSQRGKGREAEGLQIEDFGPCSAATGNGSSRSCNGSQKLELVPERKCGSTGAKDRTYHGKVPNFSNHCWTPLPPPPALLTSAYLDVSSWSPSSVTNSAEALRRLKHIGQQQVSYTCPVPHNLWKEEVGS